MIVICVFAFQQGDINRLVYGVDSYGFTCGKSTTFMGKTIDLSSKKNIYYLNPLDLLIPGNIDYAKSICVDTCPSMDTCNISSFPCTNANAFR
jgi:choline transporter-like protein 2/4/5